MFQTQRAQQAIFYLLLVPLEVGDEDKAIRGIWVLENNPVSFSLLVKNVVHPLEGAGERKGSTIVTIPGQTPQTGLGKVSALPGRKPLSSGDLYSILSLRICSLGFKRALSSPIIDTGSPATRLRSHCCADGGSLGCSWSSVHPCGPTGLVCTSPLHSTGDSCLHGPVPLCSGPQPRGWEFLLHRKLAPPGQGKA